MLKPCRQQNVISFSCAGTDPVCLSVGSGYIRNSCIAKKDFFGGLLCWEFVRKFPSNYSAIHRWTSIITLHNDRSGYSRNKVTGEVTGEVYNLLKVVGKGDSTRAEAQAALELKGEANFRERYLGPALEAGLIEMTIPEKPRSSKQKYRLTDTGRQVLIKIQGGG
jgi:hypothetical protein